MPKPLKALLRDRPTWIALVLLAVFAVRAIAQPPGDLPPEAPRFPSPVISMDSDIWISLGSLTVENLTSAGHHERARDLAASVLRSAARSERLSGATKLSFTKRFLQAARPSSRRVTLTELKGAQSLAEGYAREAPETAVEVFNELGRGYLSIGLDGEAEQVFLSAAALSEAGGERLFAQTALTRLALRRGDCPVAADRASGLLVLLGDQAGIPASGYTSARALLAKVARRCEGT